MSVSVQVGLVLAILTAFGSMVGFLYKFRGARDAPDVELRRCIDIARIEVQRVPAKTICKQALRVLWDLGVSDIPPEALPYLLGSSTMDTARLRVFLGEHYRSVIEHTCEEALADSFTNMPQASSAAKP